MPIHSFILFWLRGAFNKFVGLASVIGESDIIVIIFISSSFSTLFWVIIGLLGNMSVGSVGLSECELVVAR